MTTEAYFVARVCVGDDQVEPCWKSLTCSRDPAAIKFLSDLSIPSDPERPA